MITTVLNNQPTCTTASGECIEDIRAFYEENGFLILRNGLTPTQINELLAETLAICSGERGDEPDKFPKRLPGETDTDVFRKFLCIHFPDRVSDIMHSYLGHKAIVDVLTKIIGPNVKCMQAMLFIKAAGKPGQAWHQDEDYIPTRDRSLCGAWMALDDATVDNGCLWVIPGSHKRGILWPQREAEDRKRFACTHESYNFPFRDEDAVPVEVPAGSIVFFNGYLLHRSFPNKTKSSYRRVLVNHYMSAESLLPWQPPLKNQQMALADCRDIVMVAGEDPYAYKGIVESHSTYLRPDGTAGCHHDKVEKE